MKYEIAKCLVCNGELMFEEEFISKETRFINKNGKISKRRRFYEKVGTHLDGLCCQSCGAFYDFEEDKRGRVANISFK